MQETNSVDQRMEQSKMSFLDHLDELRRRLVNAMVIIIISFLICWGFSDKIYNFLSVPIRQALSEAEQQQLTLQGIDGNKEISPNNLLVNGERTKYVFGKTGRLGNAVIPPGTTINAIVGVDETGKMVLFSDEEITTDFYKVPKGVKLPADLSGAVVDKLSGDERMIVTTAVESFTLYVTVALYAAIALALPFLLYQIWGFISPALYAHERRYVTPFIALSTISFVVGAAFAYYILFPPAARYLLGLGEDFRIMLKASDYFDFITIIMLAMGLIFQMPAITYVLARIGLVNAGFLIRSWRVSIVVILIVAAVVSPTGDIPNMMLFAAPMMALYVVSIFIAWFFARKRKTEEVI